MAQLGHNIPGPGTLVSDSLEVDLLSGIDIDNNLVLTSGSAVTVDRPGHVAFVLQLSAITGTTPTMRVDVQASDSSTFADDVVTVASLYTSGATDDNKVYTANAYVAKKYVRASVLCTGTTPVYTGATLKTKQPHYFRGEDTTAAPIV